MGPRTFPADHAALMMLRLFWPLAFSKPLANIVILEWKNQLQSSTGTI